MFHPYRRDFDFRSDRNHLNDGCPDAYLYVCQLNVNDKKRCFVIYQMNTIGISTEKVPKNLQKFLDDPDQGFYRVTS